MKKDFRTDDKNIIIRAEVLYNGKGSYFLFVEHITLKDEGRGYVIEQTEPFSAFHTTVHHVTRKSAKQEKIAIENATPYLKDAVIQQAKLKNVNVVDEIAW